MSRVFVVHINKTELIGETDDHTMPDVEESYCNYAFTNEDEADDFVEVVTGYNPKNMGIIYGRWSERTDDKGNKWSIMYDKPYELDPVEAELSKREVLDF